MSNVLVLEDEMLIALDLEASLIELGVGEVFLSSSVDQALEIFAACPIDFAIVDFNLGIETAEPVLAELEARKIPFVVMSGYPDSRYLGDGSRVWPMLTKPASAVALREVVTELRDRKSAG